MPILPRPLLVLVLLDQGENVNRPVITAEAQKSRVHIEADTEIQEKRIQITTGSTGIL